MRDKQRREERMGAILDGLAVALFMLVMLLAGVVLMCLAPAA